MRLKQHISESMERSVSISPEEAFEGIRSHCKNALNSYKKDKMVYRGVYMDQPTYLIKPGEHTRKSANTANTYTLLIDNSKKWVKYPKRSKSIICSTKSSNSSGYGSLFVVFPKDGYKFGVCSSFDMWESFSSKIKTSLHSFNYSIDRLIESLSIEFDIHNMEKYEDLKLMCKKIDMVLQNTQERNTRVFRWLFDYDMYGNFMDLLESLFDPEDNGFKVVNDIKELPNVDHEVWTDSDSYLVSYNWLMTAEDGQMEKRLIG